MSRTLPYVWFLAMEWLKGHQRAIYGAKNACFELSVLWQYYCHDNRKDKRPVSTAH
jgi:hypothetical protein